MVWCFACDYLTCFVVISAIHDFTVWGLVFDWCLMVLAWMTLFCVLRTLDFGRFVLVWHPYFGFSFVCAGGVCGLLYTWISSCVVCYVWMLVLFGFVCFARFVSFVWLVDFAEFAFWIV